MLHLRLVAPSLPLLSPRVPSRHLHWVSWDSEGGTFPPGHVSAKIQGSSPMAPPCCPSSASQDAVLDLGCTLWPKSHRCCGCYGVTAEAVEPLLRLWIHCQDCGAAAEALGLLLRLWDHCQGCRTAAHLAALCSLHLAPSRFPSRVRPGPDVCGTLAWLALH